VRHFLLTLVLLLTAPASTLFVLASPAEARNTCGSSDYYRNARGNCVHRPVHSSVVPAGASAKCRDGTYSFSQSRRGTCSWHGGVAVWL
jgi:hypothetical protein